MGSTEGRFSPDLQELVREMCGFACYMACWRPVLYQQLHCFNLADPELPAPNPPDANFYRSLLVSPTATVPDTARHGDRRV